MDVEQGSLLLQTVVVESLHGGGTIGSWAENAGDIGVHKLTGKNRPAHEYPDLERWRSRYTWRSWWERGFQGRSADGSDTFFKWPVISPELAIP